MIASLCSTTDRIPMPHHSFSLHPFLRFQTTTAFLHAADYTNFSYLFLFYSYISTGPLVCKCEWCYNYNCGPTMPFHILTCVPSPKAMQIYTVFIYQTSSTTVCILIFIEGAYRAPTDSRDHKINFRTRELLINDLVRPLFIYGISVHNLNMHI